MTKKHKPASAKSRKAAPTVPIAPVETTAAPNLARIHNISGYMVFSLMPGLRAIIGEEGYARCVKDFEDQGLVFLIHTDSDVIYLRSQRVVMPQRWTTAA